MPAEKKTPAKAATPASPTPEAPEISPEEVQQAAMDYYTKLTDAAARLSEQAEHVYDLSHSYAREHPVGTILGALGVGVLLGVLFDRS